MKNIKFLQKALLAFLILMSVSHGTQSQELKKEEIISIKTSAVCSMCKDRIEREMAFEKGVKEVKLDVKTQVVTLTYKTSKTNPDKLRTAITKIGYNADDKTADPKLMKNFRIVVKKIIPCINCSFTVAISQRKG